MIKHLTIFYVFILLALTAPQLLSQSTISGKVTDSLSTEPLIGANIVIAGTSLGASSNIEGSYKISGVHAGNYILKVSYIGYKPKEYNLTVEAGKNLYLNLAIRADVIEGQEIIITGQAFGQVAAINQQLTSTTIMNVISEQKIQELPDYNAAESIGRLPGVALVRSGGEATQVSLRGLSPKFSSVTLDGFRVSSTDPDTRGVDLSTISQGSLAGIELYKALTADKDADAIAGSVNLVTRKAPVNRLLYVDAKGSYNKLDNTYNQYDFIGRYGERFFSNILGVQLQGNIEKRIRSNESDAFTYDVTSLKNGADWRETNFQLTYVSEIRKRSGFGLLLDFSTPDSGTIKINAVYNKTSRDYMTYGRNYPSWNGSTFIEYTAKEVQQDISTVNSYISGDNNLLGLSIQWGLNFAQSKAEIPFDYQLEFQEGSALDSNGNTIAGMRFIPDTYYHGPAEQIITYACNNYNYASLNNAFNRKAKNYSKENGFYLDLAKGYTFGDYIAGELKGGGRYRANTKFRDSSEYISPYYINGVSRYTKLGDGTIVPKNFAGTRFSDTPLGAGKTLVTYFLDGNFPSRNIYGIYNLNPLISKDALTLWHDLNINGYSGTDGSGPEYTENISLSAGNYNMTEQISAAYLMNTLKISDMFTVITGLRVESENNKYYAKYSPNTLAGFPAPSGEIRDTSSTHKETIWLPNLQVLYKPLDFMNIRLAAYRSLSRPDYNRRLPTYIIQAAGTFYPNNNLTIGNPGLKDAKAYNFELNTSFYSNYIGLFSVSGYYKEIKDMYHSVNGILVSYQDGQRILDSLGLHVVNPFGNGDFNISYQSNSNKLTKVWGFEVEHQINFWFLPSLLSNFVLSYNFSFIRSETTVPRSATQIYYIQIGPIKLKKQKPVIQDVKQNLENSPDFLLNVSLGYDIGGFSARISVFHQSASNSFFSWNGETDVQVNAFTRWDMTLKQKINDHIAVTLSINNLTNVEEGTSYVNRIQGWTLPYTTQRYGLSGDLGVRLTL